MLLNKKLTIAVLTFGLLLTLGSAAFGSDVFKVRGVETPINTPNLNAPKAADINIINQVENLERPAMIRHIATPMMVLPPDYFCNWYAYYGDPYYVISLPDYMGNPFDKWLARITTEEGYTCTLISMSVYVITDYCVGDPILRLGLWDISRTLVDYVDVPVASFPAGDGWVDVTLTGGPHTFYNGEEFYVGVQAITDSPDDTIYFLFDDGANYEGRTIGQIGTGWYSYGLNMFAGADLCCDRIPYTSCYRQEYDCGMGSVWPQPDAYGDDYFNMQFDVAGPETLMAIGVAMYNSPGAGYPFEIGGTPDLDIFVWGDDGTGFPNLADEIYSTTIPFANITYFNISGLYNVVDLSGLNIVVTSKFHVGWSTNELSDPTGWLVGLGDDGTCGTGRSSEYWNGTWGTMLGDWGFDVNFLIFADLCKDEFADCQTWAQYYAPKYILNCPDDYCDRGFATRYSISGEGCRLENFWVMYYWHPAHTPALGYDLYTTESEIFVALPEAGTGYPDPAAKVLTKTLTTYADYGYGGTPGTGGWWKRYDFTADNYRFDHDIWIGLENEGCDKFVGVELVKDDWDILPLLDRSAELYYDAWEYIVEGWGGTFNVVWDAEVCCVPIPSRACTDDEDWPTYGSEFSHDNASLNSVGNAQCNLTKVWMVQMDEAMSTASPVIYKDTIVGCWSNRIAAFDINNGNVFWETVRGTYGNLVIGSNLQCTPTVMNMTDFGDSRTFVFMGGGNARAFAVFDLATGDTIWTRKVTVHGTNTFTLGISIVLDIAGTPVLFYAADGGDLYAVNALTGADFWTTNPVYHGPGGGTQRGLGTD